MSKITYIIAGGTFVDVAPHFSLSAPAFGTVGRELAALMPEARLILTRMALGGAARSEADAALFHEAGIRDLRTNDDLRRLTDILVSRADTGGIVMAAAVCDFAAPYQNARHDSSKPPVLALAQAEKIVSGLRKERKDIFLVGFKTTAGAAADAQYGAGLALLKRASCNLVLANDLQTRRNMIITPEQARYHETTDRAEALKGLAEMIALRSRLTFTRATVIPGAPVAWRSPLIPETLRTVVDHCIRRGAYKPFLASTVGHFAVKVDARRILTSRRKTDFNRLDDVGLVMIEADGPDAVIAHGSKPSVGGQSQRIIFAEHPDVDCIVHFHCPMRIGSRVPVRSQREFECGSHECGKNTSTGLARFGSVLAVMLDKHGPNVVFAKDADPKEVIRFIEANFDLEDRTDDVEDDGALAPFFMAAPATA